MSKLVFVLVPVFLSGLILGPPTTFAVVTYYVSSSSQNCSEASEPCHSLEDYVANSSKFFSSDKDSVTLIFLNGTHISSRSKFVVTASINFTMKGESQTVAIESVELDIEVQILNISSIVLNGSSNLRVRPVPTANAITVQVVDCKFVEHSFLKTIYSILNLSNSEFLSISLSPNDNPLTAYYSEVFLRETRFVGSSQTAILALDSNITFDQTVDFINNTGVGGGALSLFSTRIYFANTANIHFINNTALTIGGAIYVELGEIVRPDSDFGVFRCFYQVLSPLSSTAFQVFFSDNSAEFGGDDIYGTALNSSCQVSSSDNSFKIAPFEHFHFDTYGPSSVSSSPQRVCICDGDGIPQCADLSKIYMTREAYPGETITIPTVIVGTDFGRTVGTVYVGFLEYVDQSTTRKVSDYQNCTTIYYTLHPRNSESNYTVMHLSTIQFDDKRYFKSQYHNHEEYIRGAINTYNKNRTISFFLLTTPVYINITFLNCPPGLSLRSVRSTRFQNNTRSCDCHPEFRNNIQCHIDNSSVHFLWSSNAWIGVDNITETNRILYSNNCPFDYCRDGEKSVDYIKGNDPNDQCAFNRAGVLCGGCRENYSLAIGSSRCISCSNNNYLALLIFFAAAGFLLVLFVSIVNLTVTQGMINGLVFYANIVWAYQNIVLPQEYNTDTINSGFSIVKIFLAWLNLDFGIETCFIRGLDGFWKTWLQFVFPFYTAGLFFLGLRFSSKLSKLFGDRSVPTLATLLFLSYTKLLRTIIAALGLAQIKIFSNDSTVRTVAVWSVDGNLRYGVHPHIFLVLVAIACLLFLWLPYTLLLLLMQWLRKVPHSKLSQWITRYKPVFDTHYAPLKDKHHYWFGVLLHVQGVLLFISSLISNIYPNVSLFLLLTLATLLLFYMSFMQVYRRIVVLVAESSFFINLILLTGGFILFNGERGRMIVLYVSISIAFLEFCGIVVWSLIMTYFLKFRRNKGSERPLLSRPNTSYTNIEEEQVTQRDSDRSTPVPVTSTYVQFRDSILVDSLTVSTEKEPSHTHSSY